MQTLGAGLSKGQALILGLAVIGCATAGLITGHLTAGDWGTAVGLTVGVGGIVGTAHVVGTQVNAANPPGVAPVAPADNTGTAGTV